MTRRQRRPAPPRTAVATAPAALALALVLASPAAAQLPDGEFRTPATAPPAIEGPGARGPLAPQPLVDVDDPVFVGLAASFLQLAADAGRLARTQSSDAGVRRLARAFTASHLEALDALAAGATTDRFDTGFPPLDERLVRGHERMLLDLSAKRGAAFDRGYLDLQLQVHRQLDAMLAAYAAAGSDPQLRVVAARTLATVRDHLERLGAEAPAG